GGLEWWAGNCVALGCAQILDRAVVQQLRVVASDAVAPFGVALVADHYLGSLRESGGDALREPQRRRCIAVPRNEQRRHGRLDRRAIGGSRNSRPLPACGLLLAYAIVAQQRVLGRGRDVCFLDECDVVVAGDREQQPQAQRRIGTGGVLQDALLDRLP